MPPRPSARRSDHPGVTREDVLEAAERLSRTHGLDVWPLPTLLADLGTSFSVVDRLVGDRSALSAAVVDSVVGAVPRPGPTVGWRPWLHEALTGVRTVALRTPGVARWLLTHGGATPRIAPILAEGLDVLRRAGFDEEAPQALMFAVTTAIGVVAMGDEGPDTPAARAEPLRALETTDPGLAGLREVVATMGAPGGPDATFDYVLARTLDGLEHHLTRRRAHYSDLVIERLTDTDPFALAEESAAELSERTGVTRHDVALILGSGWAAAADQLGEVVATIPADELPGFRSSAVVGHASTVRSISVPREDAEPLRALVLPRSHYYEGHGVRAVAHGVRVAAAAGCRTIVLTNGCGGLDRSIPAGSPVLISDHLNFTGASPLEGPTFVDLTDLYSTDLRALARTVDPTLPEGVYAQFHGPHYETPAEVRMAGILGASLVGMSTGLEAIAARHVGMKVLGFSLVTNLAAGVSDQPLSHEEVLQAGRDAAPRCAALLAGVTRLL